MLVDVESLVILYQPLYFISPYRTKPCHVIRYRDAASLGYARSEPSYETTTILQLESCHQVQPSASPGYAGNEPSWSMALVQGYERMLIEDELRLI